MVMAVKWLFRRRLPALHPSRLREGLPQRPLYYVRWGRLRSTRAVHRLQGELAACPIHIPPLYDPNRQNLQVRPSDRASDRGRRHRLASCPADRALTVGEKTA
jgi:hypothetical protein